MQGSWIKSFIRLYQLLSNGLHFLLLKVWLKKCLYILTIEGISMLIFEKAYQAFFCLGMARLKDLCSKNLDFNKIWRTKCKWASYPSDCLCKNPTHPHHFKIYGKLGIGCGCPWIWKNKWWFQDYHFKHKNKSLE